MAVAFSKYVRATCAMDILARADQANIRCLLKSLSDFGEGHAQGLSLTDFTIEEGAIRVIEDFPLDIFTQMSGRTYKDLLSFTDEHLVAGAIQYLSAEGLLELRADPMRPKDQQDVQALRQIMQQKGES